MFGLEEALGELEMAETVKCCVRQGEKGAGGVYAVEPSQRDEDRRDRYLNLQKKVGIGRDDCAAYSLNESRRGQVLMYAKQLLMEQEVLAIVCVDKEIRI